MPDTGGGNLPLIHEIYTIDADRSNAMKSANPNSGIHKADIAKTIDSSVPAPNKAQGGQMVCCFHGAQDPINSNDHANPVGRNQGQENCLAQAMTVRRLTTVECARLQGFPDHYTEIPWRGKPPEQCPRAPQYKAYGNSMCVNVIEWLGKRIEQELNNPQPLTLYQPEQMEFEF